MPKYYEGEAVVKAFTETTNQSATWARGVLASMKEADAAPVIHAAWLLEGVDHFWNKYIFVCSRCKRREKVSQRKDLKDFPYCHCGAKMYDPYDDLQAKMDEEEMEK